MINISVKKKTNYSDIVIVNENYMWGKDSSEKISLVYILNLNNLNLKSA